METGAGGASLTERRRMDTTGTGGRAITAIEPFRGLRYDPRVVNPDDVIAPPYDVVTDEDVRALRGHSPYNIAHVETPGVGEAAYRDAAEALRRWQAAGVLCRDETPAYYAYEQRFSLHGATHVRRCFFARLRLHEPDEGIVRPHEATMSGPVEDRLNLLRATRTNVSPIFAMFEDTARQAQAVLEDADRREPAFEATEENGDRHRLWVVDGPEVTRALTDALAASNVTIADGHHRYRTALTYRREDTSEAAQWVLAGMVPVDDPGLLVLPNHRLVKADAVPADFLARLSELYDIVALAPEPWGGAAVRRTWEEASKAGGGTTFGVLGIEPGRLHVLTARSAEDVDRAMPQHWSPALRALDVTILTQTVLAPRLGIDQVALVAGERVAFTEEVEEAWRQVEAGRYRLAFLINPVRVAQIIAVADAGEVMPQKATFFYPKLRTGMVLNPLD